MTLKTTSKSLNGHVSQWALSTTVFIAQRHDLELFHDSSLVGKIPDFDDTE